MKPPEPTKKIAIVGGGPAGLFIYKKLVEARATQCAVHIFEAGHQPGAGMPYSYEGAAAEHITNISGNEIPPLVTPLLQWIKQQPNTVLDAFNIDREQFTAYKVLPRLLFGQYLQDQFHQLLQKGKAAGIVTSLHPGCRVTNIIDQPEQCSTIIEVNGKEQMEFDHVIICTGHHWPLTYERKVEGFFDSPYPPSKIARQFNHPVAIKGSSLTAIDAMRTLARQHGHFKELLPGKISYVPDQQADQFKIAMFSLHGLLPGIRFHLDDPHLSNDSLLTEEEIKEHMAANDGFLSLDFIFENDFKEPLKEKDPVFYEHIRHMSLEAFTEELMNKRERMDPFVLFKKEYDEARLSISRKESVHWKELLAGLSFAINYPAKHLSAEDMVRLKKVLMPLISIVIAFVPQSSCEELIALHEANRLEIIPVDEDSHVEAGEDGKIIYHYTDEDGNHCKKTFQTYIDCTGQPHLSVKDFPFSGLVKNKSVTPAQLPFRSAQVAEELLQAGNKEVVKGKDNRFYLQVPGITITDSFRAAGSQDAGNPRIYVMAVPFIGGYNPDYSGLDFCEEAATRIVDDLMQQETNH